jgi:hypothetical protein
LPEHLASDSSGRLPDLQEFKYFRQTRSSLDSSDHDAEGDTEQCRTPRYEQRIAPEPAGGNQHGDQRWRKEGADVTDLIE